MPGFTPPPAGGFYPELSTGLVDGEPPCCEVCGRAAALYTVDVDSTPRYACRAHHGVVTIRLIQAAYTPPNPQEVPAS